MSDMFNLPPAIQELKSALNKLPSIGPRSAERIALHIVQCKKDPIDKLLHAIQDAKEKVTLCEICGGLTENQPCGLCSDPSRQKAGGKNNSCNYQTAGFAKRYYLRFALNADCFVCGDNKCCACGRGTMQINTLR